VALALLAGVVLLLVPGQTLRRALAGLCCALQLGLAVWLVWLTAGSAGDAGAPWEPARLVLGLGGWVPPLGIVLVVDLLAAVMLLLCAVMAAAGHAYGFMEVPAREEHPLRLPLWQFLIAGVNLSFVTGDLFNLFVAFEVMLIASYALLTLEADDWDVKQAYPYVALNLVGGLLFLISVGFVYGVFGTLNLAQLSQRLAEAEGHPVVLLAAVLLLAVFGLKAGVFPLYYWLPGSYPILSAPLAAFFGAMLTKVGVYALLRIFGTVFPHSLTEIHQALGWIGALTAFFGVCWAVSRGFARGILAAHILSQIGYMVLAIGLFSVHAFAACIFHLAHNALVKGGLFLAAAAAAGRRRGGDDLAAGGGVARAHPVLAGGFFVLAAALAGVPPLSGFWGKLLIFIEGFRTGYERLPAAYVWVALAAVTGIFTLFSMLKIWNTMFWGAPEEAPPAGPPGHRGRVGLLAALALGAVVLGASVGPALTLAQRAAAAALDRAGYAADVLGIPGKGRAHP
jgi:multicomponent Na+:H+ antiporter subunit D